MKQICGMSVRRTFRGPASLLASVVDENNEQHTAIVFYEQFHNHPALNDSLFIVLDFLQAPFVIGMAELLVHQPENGAFVFGTGPSLSIAEIIRTATDLNLKTGARTGLELMYKVGQVLVEASFAAQTYTVFSHGGLTPWRLMLKDNSDVSVIGYALPQVEMLDFQRDDRMKPTEDSFRYSPPERIRAEPEDLSSDVFSLGLIAFEMMTLTPIYDGTVDSIRQRAIRGDASQQIYAARDTIPLPVAKLLEKTLQSNRESRFYSGKEFLSAIEKLLDNPEITGISLEELLMKIKQQGTQETSPLPHNDQDFKTALLSRDKLLQNRELIKAETPAREQVFIPHNQNMDLSKNPPPKEISDLGESQSAITSSGSSWKPVERKRTKKEEPSVSNSNPSVDRSSPVSERKQEPRRGGVSEIVKMLRESQRDLNSDVLVPLANASNSQTNSKTKPEKENTDSVDELAKEMPSFVRKINRKRTKKKSSSSEEKNQALELKEGPPVPKVKDVLSSEEGAVDTQEKTDIHKVKAEKKKKKQTKTSQKTEAKSTKPTKAKTTKSKASQSKPSKETQEKETPLSKSSYQTLLESPIFSFPGFSVGSKNVKRYTVNRNPGERSVRFRAAAHNSTAEFVSVLLTNRLLPLRMSLDGRLLGWYRFSQGERTFLGHELMSELDSDCPIELVCLPVQTELVDIEIHLEEKIISYRTPVANTVPVISIIDHLIGLYSLRSEGWGLFIGETQMGWHDVLWDYQNNPKSCLKLKLKTLD